jgi:hypothetical protein
VVSARPEWKPSFFGALWGVILGSLASGFFMGAVVVLVHMVSGRPVPDALFTALEPLGYFNVVPIVMAIGIDVVCRREAFWLSTGRRPAVELTIITSVIAPSSAVWIDWPDGGTIFWVLAASTAILRLGTVPVSAAPRWFLLRSRTERAVVVLAALAIAAGGVFAYQIARPAIGTTVLPTDSPIAITSNHGRFVNGFDVHNRLLSNVTVLGVDGFDRKFMHLERGSVRGPFAIGGRASTSVLLVVDPSECITGSFSEVSVRYRVLSIERTTHVALPQPISLRCSPAGR